MSFAGDIVIDRDIRVNLKGGGDAGFLTFTGTTIANGNMVITNGKVTISGGVFQLQ